jgi:hypothetical protein
MSETDIVIEDAIRGAIINNIMNIYRDTIRNVRNPNRNIMTPSIRLNNIISSRYYNDPPRGGYDLNEEHEYILPDHDDLSAMVFLDVVTRFGSPGSDCERELRRTKIKQIGKYKKIKESDTTLIQSDCPICLENFQVGEYYRSLDCNHCYHKKCIDKWFKKDHSECPMCRKTIIN